MMPFARTTFDTNDAGETLVYDVERLWREADGLVVEEISLKIVEDELDYPYQWFKTTEPSPREVARHAKRIYDADLSYPILLSHGGVVLDGIHRIARAWLEGRKTIRAVRFPETLAPDRVIANP